MKNDIEKIYSDYAATVYKFLFCLCGDPGLAEDLTQETFLEAMKQIDRFRGDCKLSVWLCQIAKYCWYGHLKRKKKENVSLEEIPERLFAYSDMEDDFLYQCDKIELFRNMQKLDEKIKEVMYLRLTGELSFSEIGDILGKSENYARVLFYRGKKELMKGRDQDGNPS